MRPACRIRRHARIVLIALLALLAWPTALSADTPATAPALLFVQDMGQYGGDPATPRFVALGGDTPVWLASDGLWLSKTTGGKITHVRLRPKSLAPDATLEPFGALATRLSFFLGDDPAAWQRDVPTWGGVVWQNAAHGLDLEITAQGGALALRWVSPTGLSGADLRTAAEAVQWEIDGGDVDLPEISLEAQPAATSASPHLLYSTLIPGSGSGTTNMILPPDQCPILVGDSLSLDFPTTPGAYDRAPKGSRDIWVCKLNSVGSGVLWATYIGGGRHESAYGLDLGPGGDVYLAGDTMSVNFPVTPGVYDGYYSGSYDESEAFCLRLAADGSALVWSTFIGGSGWDWARDLAVDDAGRAFVVGTSTSGDLAGTAGSADPTHNGAYDAFLFALNADGASLHYGAFIGGATDDGANGVALDAAGNAYLVGSTTSTDFPTTPGAYKDTLDYGGSVFVAQVAAGGGTLAYNTLVGQSTWYFYSNHEPGGIAVDPLGRAVIAGPATINGFPTTPGAYDTSPNGRGDAYVTRLSADGSALDASTLLGGSDDDSGHKLALDATGAIVLCGSSASTNLPTTGDRIQPAYGGGNQDAFVARLSPDLSALTYSTWLGGEGWDMAVGLGVAWSGEIVVAGQTASEGFPTTVGAWSEGLNGAVGEAFVSRVRPASGGSVASRASLPVVLK